MKTTILKFAAIVLALAAGTAASAAEVRVLSTMALRSVMEEMVPQFERAGGHRVIAVYDTSNLMAARVIRARGLEPG